MGGSRNLVEGCSFLRCSAGEFGGGLGFTTMVKASLHVKDSLFSNCSAPQGAAMTIESGEALVENTIVKGGVSGVGAGISFVVAYDTIPNKLEIERSAFYENNASAAGSCLHLSGSDVTTGVRIESSVFASSSAMVSGGAVDSDDTIALVVNNSRFHRLLSASGGAISATGNLSILGSSFLDNVAQLRGGALQLTGSSHVSNSTFLDNRVIAEEEECVILTLTLVSNWGTGWYGAKLNLISDTSLDDPSFSNITLESGYSSELEACLPGGSVYNVTTTNTVGFYSTIGHSIVSWWIEDLVAGSVLESTQFTVPETEWICQGYA